MAPDLSAFGNEIDLALQALTAPEVRRREIQAAADALLKEAEREIRTAGGGKPRHRTFVDGKAVDNLDGINPDHCVIEFVFDMGVPVEVIQAVLDLLRANSPVLTGAYQASHRVYADRVDVTDQMPLAPETAAAVKEFVIQPTVPYGRKVERWHAVYEGTTALAQRRFGNQAAIGFEFRSPILPYVAGGANRAERAAIRNQPNRRAAMRTERATRLPCIFFVPVGG